MITHASELVPVTLADWADHLTGRLEGADAGAHVRGLADDSRRVEAGHLFFARRGSTDDGRRWAADAVENGAVAVVTEEGDARGLPVLRVPSSTNALAQAADTWYGRPQDALDLVAVTGTKGKTTTAWLIAAALRYADVPTAVLGTIAHDLGRGRVEMAHNTTPGLLDLRRLLATAVRHRCRAAVMEVSSHALDQGRVEGLDFRVAVFTNLGRDHLDYHKDVEAYFRAKSLLFSGLGHAATAVLNLDDERWSSLAALCRGRVITYGTGPEADLRLRDVETGLDGTRLRLVVSGEAELDVETPLAGQHNARNLVAAIGAAKGLGVDIVKSARGAGSLGEIPGRLQRVRASSDLDVFVDYAHTSEALGEVISFLREAGAADLVCVVGCGGDRDRDKRPRMARIAAEGCTAAYLTSDNPRTEDPSAILRDMEAGVSGAARDRMRIVRDRRRAIERAILEAPPGACVLVAGKGHETYQILGDRKIHFDDAEEVRRALALRAQSPAADPVRH